MARSAVVKVAIVADNSKLNSGLAQSESRLKSFGKSVVKAGIAAGIAAGAGVAVLAKKSIEAASKAQQSMGATETVFGRFADQVVKDSKRAANSVGLSANEYRESANLIGSLFKNQGVAIDELGGKTKTMVKTAADLAATFGGPTSDAVEALASAFKGEFDPLEKYGISVKQAAITTEAWAVAGVDTAAAFKELSTEQQAAAKQTATTNLLMGQSKQTMGAFAKETNTLAHQQQVLGAQWENLKAKIGTALLPVVTRLFKVFNKELMPELNRLANKILPDVERALTKGAKAAEKWLRNFDPGQTLAKFKQALSGIDVGKTSDDVSELADSAKVLRQQLSKVSADTVNDSLKVFSVLVGFAADHVDELARFLPLIVAGFVAFKAAQTLNNIAGRDSVFGLIAQVYQTRQLKQATDALAVSLERAAVANGTAGLAGSASKAAGAMKLLGGAAKAGAGIAGIGLMTSAADDSTGALKTLKSVGGGALTGFAVGGPIGAAIGGAAGLLLDLTTNTNKAAEAAKRSVGDWTSAASAIDLYSGALTEAYRAEVVKTLADSKAFEAAEQLGISRQTLVDAAMGERDALVTISQARSSEVSSIEALRRKRQELIDQAKVVINEETGAVAINRQVEQANKDQVESLEAQIAARKENLGFLDETLQTQAEANRQQRETNNLIVDWDKRLRGLPPEVVTRVEQHGGVKTLKFVAQLAKKYRLTPKEIKTTLRAFGFKDGERQVDKVKAKIKDLNNTKPDLNRFARGVAIDVDNIARDAGKGGEKVAKAVKDKSSKVKWNKIPFLGSIASGLATAKTRASTGSKGVGESLKSGILLGAFGMGDALAAQMSADVRQGIAAARAAAKAQSPSKETMRLGKDLVDGLIKGVQAGSDGVERALEGMSTFVTNTLDRQLKARQASIKKRLDGKAEKAALRALARHWRAHVREVSAALKDEREALRANGREQDALASGNLIPFLKTSSKLFKQMREAGVHNLEEARDRLADLTQAAADYASSIRDVFVSFGDVTQLGRDEETGVVSFPAMMEQLATRAQQAQEFAALIQKFARKGLSQTVIDQLIAAGPEAGLQTAQAIDAGITATGQAAIDQINEMTAQIAAAGDETGVVLNKKFNDAGIAAAQGLVDGLVAKAEELDKIARRLARKLVEAIKDELGIKSPSRVMAGIGAQVSTGLALGINETHARAAGSGLAAALLDGFGTPGLRPTLAANTIDSQRGRIDVTLRAHQISDLERGRSIQISLDTYHAAGGRAAAR